MPISTILLLTVGLTLMACSKSEQPAATQTQEHSAAAPAPINPATVATIQGTVHFQGTAPAPIRIRMDAVPYCVKANSGPVYTQEVEINENQTLKDVFVYIKEGLENRTFPVPSESVELDQKGCWYYPHVLGIMASQKLDVKNNDNTEHNIHVLPNVNREWNMSMPPGAPDLIQEFARPEVMIPVKCNVHPWMKAYIGVVRNPFYAVTGKEGTFSIAGLPPGEYTIEAWQEKYGTQDQKITVGPKETKTVDFTFHG
jgi:Carboxypeptidase regulatory-like domain